MKSNTVLAAAILLGATLTLGSCTSKTAQEGDSSTMGTPAAQSDINSMDVDTTMGAGNPNMGTTAGASMGTTDMGTTTTDMNTTTGTTDMSTTTTGMNTTAGSTAGNTTAGMSTTSGMGTNTTNTNTGATTSGSTTTATTAGTTTSY